MENNLEKFFRPKRRSQPQKLGDFKEKVFQFLQEIPKGRITTYGRVARFCGILNPRNVGWILQQNEDEKIPCYKVVGAGGKLTYGYKFGGKEWQKKHLIEEGIEFGENETIKDFKNKIWPSK